MDYSIEQGLSFRKIKEEDFVFLFLLWHDLDLIKYTYHQYQKDLEAAQQKVLKVLNRYAQLGIGAGPFLFFKDETFIGYAGMELKSETLKEFEIWYIIPRNEHGKGYATSIAKILTTMAFNTLMAQRVLADVVAINIPSMRVLEKTGLHQVGRLSNQFSKNDLVLDLLIYGLSRAQWLEMQKP